MRTDKQTSIPIAYQQQTVCEDEVSLIDIYLTIKRNRKLFFTVIILSFFTSLAITYFKYTSQAQTKVFSNIPALITEHILIIEIGRIFGDKSYYINQPANILEKIETIYIPKLNQPAIKAEHIKESDLILITATEISDKIDYKKILLTLAGYILKDHNTGLNLKNKNSIKPTKIIQQPTTRIVENKNKNKMLIPVLGIILGIFLGFFAVFIREFLNKIKEAEKTA